MHAVTATLRPAGQHGRSRASIAARTAERFRSLSAVPAARPCIPQYRSIRGGPLASALQLAAALFQALHRGSPSFRLTELRLTELVAAH